MIMKVMTYANDRKTVIEKMRSVLGEIIIEGVTTNTDFMYDICQNEKFIKGDVSTCLLYTSWLSMDLHMMQLLDFH